MQSKIFNFQNRVQVTYSFRGHQADCQHLLVVMSGFNVPDPTIYDWQHALSHCHSHILWIKDDFDQLPCYYLCKGMSFDIEHAVSALIEGVIGIVKPRHVSILGGSKGGSMALYYGLKHKMENIISGVPQFHIGSYVNLGSYWEHVGQHMMGSINETKVQLLDNLLKKRIRQTKDYTGHLYLFTSPNDSQFHSEIEPNLPLFDDFPNFNLIQTHSPLVTEHNQVVGYNVNLMLSLIYQFEAGISPRWGKIKNGSGWPGHSSA